MRPPAAARTNSTATTRRTPWFAVLPLGILLTGCGLFGGDDEAGKDGNAAEESDSADSADVPQGYQEIDADAVNFAVPEDWEPSSEGQEELEHSHEKLDDGGSTVAIAGIIPVEGVGSESEATEITSDLAGEVPIGNTVRDMDTGQDAEVPGARSAARNDYEIELPPDGYADFQYVTDIALITEKDEGMAFRLVVLDDAVDESRQKEILGSVRVA
ncbi:hypothetical protein FHX37_0802 [Haloactinospora alba]|uniref:Lipoprotein LpqN n=2 Tax=Haloactinospora alba TaxID=405555 RepID=A0A543NGI2_9ACTN|nr:hypothetical protein FHX37_0802 [Haloactinospora alba]